MNLLITGIVLVIAVVISLLVRTHVNKRKKKVTKNKKIVTPKTPEITTSRKSRGSPRRKK